MDYAILVLNNEFERLRDQYERINNFKSIDADSDYAEILRKDREMLRDKLDELDRAMDKLGSM